jgi:hypothetical protein
MDMEITRSEDVPHNELTELCDRMLDVVHTPERRHLQAVVMLQDQESNDGGMGLHGYDDEADAVTDILYHVKALLEAIGNGTRLVVINQAGKVMPI